MSSVFTGSGGGGIHGQVRQQSNALQNEIWDNSASLQEQIHQQGQQIAADTVQNAKDIQRQCLELFQIGLSQAEEKGRLQSAQAAPPSESKFDENGRLKSRGSSGLTPSERHEMGLD
jgi:hypothetical protein